MISRFRSLASALEFYLRTNGEAAVAITNRANLESERIRQTMKLDVEAAVMRRRSVETNERSTEMFPVFIDTMRSFGPVVTRIEAKLDAWGPPSPTPGEEP